MSATTPNVQDLFNKIGVADEIELWTRAADKNVDISVRRIYQLIAMRIGELESAERDLAAQLADMPGRVERTQKDLATGGHVDAGWIAQAATRIAEAAAKRQALTDEIVKLVWVLAPQG